MAIADPFSSHDDTIDAGSDYGTDFDDDDATIAYLDSQTPQPVPHCTRLRSEDVDEPDLPQQQDEAQTHSLRLARVELDAVIESHEHTGRLLQALQQSLVGQIKPEPLDTEPDPETPTCSRKQAIKFEHSETNSTPLARVQVKGEIVENTDVEIKHESPPPEQPDATDTRSPIERFRTAPKKPLSVTDLVSPAWCEQQYWYSLTKYGRIKRTPAMVQGSKIHKEKEREVHTEVPVQIASKEDKLGLRMWNIIQGLRTLRATGLTRELEVFGVVEGEVIIGILDELSYNCPDESLQADMLDAAAAPTCGKQGKKKMTLLPDQSTMHDFFGNQQADILNSQSAWSSSPKVRKSIYLVDIKTRRSRTLPHPPSRMRPTQMQLMLYHRLLEDLAADRVEADRVFERYRLNAHAPFTDTFIAALAGIDFSSSSQRSKVDDEDDEFPGHEEDPLDEILTYNTLSTLWSHMIAEFAKTIPAGAVSPLLTAEFRSSDTGDVIGKKCFAFDADRLEEYVSSEMKWWRGERATQGVPIEEADKCRMCEFAEGCTWRIGKMEESTQKFRLKTQTRSRSQA